MSFMKKMLLGGGLLALIFWGGAGTQSQSLLMQGGGFLSLLIALVVLYIFSKMAFRVFGFFPAILMLCGIGVFMLYAIGAFNNGLGGVGENIKAFLGQSKQGSNSGMGTISESFPPEQESNQELFGPLQKQPAQAAPNIDTLPKIQGTATVVSAGKLVINGRYFVLFGLDAPDPNQTCADAKGRAYNCGQSAARWLRSWVNDYTLECRVMRANAKGSMLGTCSLGEYDIGAALVNAGWALAYTQDTTIYQPYQAQAQKHGRGLWQGKFYKPWEWREIQSTRPKIEIIKPKGEGFFGF